MPQTADYVRHIGEVAVVFGINSAIFTTVKIVKFNTTTAEDNEKATNTVQGVIGLIVMIVSVIVFVLCWNKRKELMHVEH